MVDLTNRWESKNEHRDESCEPTFENEVHSEKSQSAADDGQCCDCRTGITDPALIYSNHVLQLLQVLHAEHQLLDDVKNRQDLEPSV